MVMWNKIVLSIVQLGAEKEWFLEKTNTFWLTRTQAISQNEQNWG